MGYSLPWRSTEWGQERPIQHRERHRRGGSGGGDFQGLCEELLYSLGAWINEMKINPNIFECLFPTMASLL